MKISCPELYIFSRSIKNPQFFKEIKTCSFSSVISTPPEKVSKYQECCLQIASEMFYLFSQVKILINE